MDRDFWLARWQKGQIGFHETAPNSLLTAHFAGLSVPAGRRVFVPLCGKSRDMHWLSAQGYRVAGVELSRLAAQEFFAESDLTPAVSAAGRLQCFTAAGVTIFVGDIFDLDRNLLGAVDAIYDRAALVALPESLRQRYASHIVALTAAAPQLLVTFEYDQKYLPGPPFSVAEAELRALYGATYNLACAETREVPGGLKAICPAQEKVWLARPR